MMEGTQEHQMIDDSFIEDAYEAMSDFKDGIYKKEVQEVFLKEFKDDPLLVLAPEAHLRLSEMNPGMRLTLLAEAAASVEVAPVHLERYLEQFPIDKEAIRDMFLNQRGVPQTSHESTLFSVAAPFLGIPQEPDPTLPEHRSNRWSMGGQMFEIAERRVLAPRFLLDRPGNWNENFGEFGKAADGLAGVFDEASQLSVNGDHKLDARPIWTPEYQQLSSEMKAKFLRKALSTCQLHFVFNEAFNSWFTPESADRRKRQSFDPDDRFGSTHFRERYNVAHSMLFKTHQPSSAYNEAQEQFTWDMNNTADHGGDIEEYADHRIVLAILEEFQKVNTDADINTDLLVRFWDKNRNPIFANAAVDALSSQNPTLAAGLLMERVRAEQPEHRNALASILYRLELGRLNISAEGVTYLERLYDLGEYNNPDFFVNRLTAKGQVGVFNEAKELEGFFELGNLADGQSRIKAEVLDLSYSMLFATGTDETPEKRAEREELLAEFKKEYFSFYNDEFFKETGVRFQNLSLREQGALLLFIRDADEDKKGKAFDFVRRYGETGFRTFLAMSEDSQVGDTILKLGSIQEEKIPEEIFRVFGRIIDQEEQVKSYLESIDQEAEPALTDSITGALLKRAKDTLKMYAVTAIEADQQKETIRTKELLETLGHTHEETHLFLSVFKSLKRYEKDISLEDMVGISFTIEPADQIVEEDKRSMLDIYKKNYSSNTTVRDILIEKFTTALKNPNSRFYILKHDGSVRGFIRFDEKSEGRMHASSFNIDETYQGAALGEAMLEESMDIEASRSTLVAEAAAFGKMTPNYIERGFIAKKFFDFEGKASVDIERNDPVFFDVYITKKESKEHLLEMATETYSFGTSPIVVRAKDVEVLPFELLGKGYVMTRYIVGSEGAIGAFELSAPAAE